MRARAREHDDVIVTVSASCGHKMATDSEGAATLIGVVPPVLEGTLPPVNGKDKCLTCTVCLDSFKEPKVLPCCHTFCKSCLERIVEKAEVKTNLVCPQCRSEHIVPPNGPEGFLTDFSLLELNKSLTSDLESDSPQLVCGDCDSSDAAVAFCSVCHSYLCSACLNIHKKQRSLQNHKVTSLECFDGEELKVEMNARTLYCREHPEESLKVFCLTCQVLVCLHCIVDSHQQHRLGQINEDVRREAQTKLKTLCKQAQNQLAELEENLKYIKEVEEVVAKCPACLQATINETFDSFAATLEARRLELLKEAEDSSHKNLKEIWAQKEFVETTAVGLGSALTFADRSLACSRDVELLSMSTQATRRLKELKDRKWNQGAIQGASMGVSKLKFTQSSSVWSGDLSQMTPHNPTTYLSNLGKLEESVEFAHVEANIAIPSMPSICDLGTRKELTINGSIGDRTYDFKPSDITVSVIYGKSNQQKTIKAKLSVLKTRKNPGKLKTRKNQLVSCVIPFTATCGGKHCIAVSLKVTAAELGTVEGKKTFEFPTTVSGRPAVGAKVCRGPDWKYDDHDTGTDTGVVENSEEDNKITVKWDNGGSYMYNWGEELGYDVELVNLFLGSSM